MRSLVLLLSLVSGVALADAPQCKVSADCLMLGPECCGGACSAVSKKDFKKAKKELDQKCAVASCAAPKGPHESCSAPVVCMQGRCELGHTKAWDADKKKDAKKDDASE